MPGETVGSLPPVSLITEANIFRETMYLLHESKTVVVVEYIETVVPVLYALYIAILFYLLNAKWRP